LNRELEQTREEVCDNYVLAERDGLSYARTLLKIAELACGRQQAAASVGMLRRGGLQRRISDLLDRRRDKALTLHKRSLAAIVGLFLAACVLISGTRFARAQPVEPPPPRQAGLDGSPGGSNGFAADPATLLARLRDRDARFDNRSLEIEQRWVETVSPR